jgi:hypothetical protein
MSKITVKDGIEIYYMGWRAALFFHHGWPLSATSERRCLLDNAVVAVGRPSWMRIKTGDNAGNV